MAIQEVLNGLALHNLLKNFDFDLVEVLVRFLLEGPIRKHLLHVLRLKLLQLSFLRFDLGF